MAEFTKEQLQQIEAAAKEVLWPVVWTEKRARKHFSEKITPEIVLAMVRQLLSSMEQKPVAWLLSGGGAKNNVSFDSGNAYADPLREVTPLYAAPQLPVPELPKQHWEELCHQNPDMSIGDAIVRAAWWNHCAAMLQGAEPVSNTYTLPANSFTDEELEGMAHGGNPQANVYRELLAYRAGENK